MATLAAGLTGSNAISIEEPSVGLPFNSTKKDKSKIDSGLLADLKDETTKALRDKFYKIDDIKKATQKYVSGKVQEHISTRATAVANQAFNEHVNRNAAGRFTAGSNAYEGQVAQKGVTQEATTGLIGTYGAKFAGVAAGIGVGTLINTGVDLATGSHTKKFAEEHIGKDVVTGVAAGVVGAVYEGTGAAVAEVAGVAVGTTLSEAGVAAGVAAVASAAVPVLIGLAVTAVAAVVVGSINNALRQRFPAVRHFEDGIGRGVVAAYDSVKNVAVAGYNRARNNAVKIGHATAKFAVKTAKAAVKTYNAATKAFNQGVAVVESAGKILVDDAAVGVAIAALKREKTPLEAIRRANGHIERDMKDALKSVKSAANMIPSITMGDVDDVIAKYSLQVHNQVDLAEIAATRKRINKRLDDIDQTVAALRAVATHANAQDAQWAAKFNL